MPAQGIHPRHRVRPGLPPDPQLRAWKGLAWALDLKDVVTGSSFCLRPSGLPLGLRPPPELRCRMPPGPPPRPLLMYALSYAFVLSPPPGLPRWISGVSWFVELITGERPLIRANWCRGGDLGRKDFTVVFFS